MEMVSGTQPTIKKVSKGKDGSAGEERLESPHFEKVEDSHDETTQISQGTPRHSALMGLWKAPSGGKVVKMANKDAVPKATK